MTNTQKLEIERIHTGEYLWRFKAGNGQIVSWSGETYKSIESCVNGVVIGSPVTNIIDFPASGMGYYYDGERKRVDVKVEYIDNYEDEHGRRITPESGTGLHSLRVQEFAHIITNSDQLPGILGRNPRFDGGHLIMDDDTVFHQVSPETGHCVADGCDVISEADGA